MNAKTNSNNKNNSNNSSRKYPSTTIGDRKTTTSKIATRSSNNNNNSSSTVRRTTAQQKRRKNRNIILASGSMQATTTTTMDTTPTTTSTTSTPPSTPISTPTSPASSTTSTPTSMTAPDGGNGGGGAFITSVKQRGSSKTRKKHKHIDEYDSDEEDDEFEMGSQKHKDKSATATSVLRRNKSFEATLFAIQSMRDEYEFSFENMLAWEYDVEEFDPCHFVAHLPRKETLPVENIRRPICLPKKCKDAPRNTLILDLDETLVHCSSEPISDADFVFPVLFRGIVYQVYVKKRPYLEEFLKFVSQIFEVAIFTASEKAYADKLLDILDEKRQWIRHRAFRDSCIFVDGNFLKDLTVLDRDLSTLAIIDNSPQVFGYHIDNGIPIVSWFDDEDDDELRKIMPFLWKLSQAEDVRPFIREKFKFHKVLERYKRNLK